VIVSFDQTKLEVQDLYRAGGLPRGDRPGWPSVNALYTVSAGQWTVLTGLPGSGKSEWLDAVMVNLAKQGCWHFVIFSPENWPLALHHSKILEKVVGKPFSPGPTERISPAELEDAQEWMRGKFHFAKPQRPNIVSILNEANPFSMLGTRKCGVVIDPWNFLEHHRTVGMSETEYVSSVLSEIISWVRARNCHLWLVAHPSKLQKDKNGKLPIPTPHDISGSAHFWNKCDNALCIWRDQSDYLDQRVQVHVQKVRFKHCGRIGMTMLLYDRVTGRYFEQLRAVPGSVQS
jgi:twinkle protein